MGSLTLDASLDLRKVVISIWFEVPTSVSSALAANSEAGPCDGYYHGLGQHVTSRTIPLITFGSALSSSVYGGNTLETGTNPSTDGDCPPCGNLTYTNYDVSSGSSAPTPPTFIGIHVNDSDETTSGLPDGRIVVNIQPNDQFSGTGIQVGSFDPVCKSCTLGTYEFGLVDQTYAIAYYDNFSGKSGVGTTHGSRHHILISWDVTNGSAGRGANSDPGTDTGPFISTASKMWLAIDGVNYNGADLPAVLAAAHDGTGGLGAGSAFGANDIASALVAYWAGVHDQGLGSSQPVSLSVSSVPSSPIVIPGDLSSTQCDSTTVNPSNQQIRMGDVQVFTGVSIDTSVVDNLRAFITADGNPVSPLEAQALLGKAPDILLQTTSDFITGHNRGTAGDFTPVGTISAFTPWP